MPSIAQSVQDVPHSRIRELAEIAMGMDGVLRLYFGESNLPTPDYIKQAAIRAMHDGYTFYTENAGLPSLRRALAENYQRLHGVELDPASEIVITASGVQALNVGIRCTLDPGDEALVLTPAWPNGSSCVVMANAVVRQIPHPLCGDRYTIDFDALARAVTPRTRMLLYTSPSNPLGWVATEAEQRALLEFARRHPRRVIGLILACCRLGGGVTVSHRFAPLFRVAYRADRLFWMFKRIAPSAYSRMMGVPKAYRPSSAEAAEIAASRDLLFPFKPRAEGAVFDGFTSNPVADRFPLEQLSVPTLVINAKDDPLAPYEFAVAAASRIPDAHLVTIDAGGHMFIGQSDHVRDAITAFIHRHT